MKNEEKIDTTLKKGEKKKKENIMKSQHTIKTRNGEREYIRSEIRKCRNYFSIKNEASVQSEAILPQTAKVLTRKCRLEKKRIVLV